MAVIDFTMPLNSSTPVFPGAGRPSFRKVASVENDGWSESRISMSTHLGTHMDAPYHMLAKGKKLDDYAVEEFVGQAVVIDARGQAEINSRLEKVKRGDIVLFLTGYSRKAHTKGYFNAGPVISLPTAERLAKKKPKMVGIDSWSPDKEPWPVHKILFKHGIPIVENLVNLEKALGKRFQFAALPLNLTESDGAPCRAIGIT